jgi:hypothetical protein
MNAAYVGRAVAAGRVGFGLALVVVPERVTSLWLGKDAARAGTQVVSRGLGARDVALGAGALIAPSAELRPWLIAAVLADAADLVGTLAAGDALPRAGRALVGAVAAGGVVLGTISLAGLRSQVDGV